MFPLHSTYWETQLWQEKEVEIKYDRRKKIKLFLFAGGSVAYQIRKKSTRLKTIKSQYLRSRSSS